MVQLRPDTHVEAYRFGGTYPSEWVNGHTYQVDPVEPEKAMALVEIHGSNMDSTSNSVEFWWTAEELNAVIKSLQKLITDDPPPIPKTPEEKRAFSDEWDRRYKEGQDGKRT